MNALHLHHHICSVGLFIIDFIFAVKMPVVSQEHSTPQTTVLLDNLITHSVLRNIQSLPSPVVFPLLHRHTYTALLAV